MSGPRRSGGQPRPGGPFLAGRGVEVTRALGLPEVGVTVCPRDQSRKAFTAALIRQACSSRSGMSILSACFLGCTRTSEATAITVVPSARYVAPSVAHPADFFAITSTTLPVANCTVRPTYGTSHLSESSPHARIPQRARMHVATHRPRIGMQPADSSPVVCPAAGSSSVSDRDRLSIPQLTQQRSSPYAVAAWCAT
jgi:hypothetical protein